MPVVTRYAPSPTGALHIGGARTALFNWAFARHERGQFLLRIEDTDRERSTLESEKLVLEALEWIGLSWDPVPGTGGIPRQSERGLRYREAVAELLARGHAYRCIHTEAEVEAMRERAKARGEKPRYDRSCRDKNIGPDSEQPFCIRLRVPDSGGLTRWTDLIAGPAGEDASQLDDFVIARTDGSAIYHFAVVVDDHDMAVTHVIRGREHMTSTPRQLLIYQGMGWEPPAFAHVPLLVEPGGKKLSKRQDSVSVQSYRDRGYTPEAVLNYIARLGWGHGDLEIFSQDDLARLFTLEGVGQSPSQVHDDKLVWLSQHYIKTLPRERLVSHLQRFLDAEAQRPVVVDDALLRLIDLLRERSKTLVEMAALARFYYVDELSIEPKAAAKFLKRETAPRLSELQSALEGLASWDKPSLENVFQKLIAAHAIELGALAQPVRVAVTGGTVSPPIFETLEVLGRERTLRRLGAAVAGIPA
ncbi:MAG TPA: glutamate--tRNA ligase [Myxococcota bacterium]|nr:glutamate--tRNA ligase [Myxococcota bacterium]